jgi:hypothetical protein
VAIIFLQKTNSINKAVLTTKLNKRYKDKTVQELIDSLSYVNAKPFLLRGRIPKIGNQLELGILSKLFSVDTRLADVFASKGKQVFYRAAGGRYFNIITNAATGSTQEKSITVISDLRDVVGAILSTNLYWWFTHIYSDTLHIKSYELEVFPIPVKTINAHIKSIIEPLYKDYLTDLEKNARIIKADYNTIDSFKEYRARKSKHLIDKLDWAIQPAYGLTDEEVRFIINYDIEFRTDEADE